MSVLDRASLEASPLADLHAIASELGIDGFRRLRKADLVEAIIARGGGEVREAEAEEAEAEAEAETAEVEERPRRRRGARGGRGRREPRFAEDRGQRTEAEAETAEAEAEAEAEEPRREERVAEGTVELLGNGSGFLRVNPDEPSDEDVYISAAQVRRCELVTGDVVSGPVRRPRRSERYPSLIRVETINGAPAEEVAEGTRYDDLPAGFPTEALPLETGDETVKAIATLAPLGKGSRATIVGPARSGKSEALRRLAGAIRGLEVTVVLAGVRPEEVPEWQSGPVPPVAAVTFAHSADAQGQAVEQAVEQGRRIAARGGDAVVLVDNLDGLHPASARRVLAAARNIVDGGSLTVIAVSTQPRGGETTVIALDPRLAGLHKFPALDVHASGTLRPELLVGAKGAEAIAKAHAKAAGH